MSLIELKGDGVKRSSLVKTIGISMRHTLSACGHMPHRAACEKEGGIWSGSRKKGAHMVGFKKEGIAIKEGGICFSAQCINSRRGSWWKTPRRSGLKPSHIQRVQHLQEGDYAQRLQFCHWVNRNRSLYKNILFADGTQFTRDGVNNCHNEHHWSDDNPHATVESNFQLRFSVNVWCGMINDKFVGPLVLQERLTEVRYLEFLEN
ncbi:hypothetical protein NQ317_004645 [Molorchus minor]|uniref:Uncharacterized protein n=1 Tax=Molorchus minor TaxID=1323400 RepID=A0ABQ9IZK1_9CUCU|nr:hypothetical protein NQ317_004645 [Molorchus minor]